MSTWPSSPTAVNVSERTGSQVSKSYSYRCIPSSVTHSSQKPEATTVSIEGWKGKQNVLGTYNERASNLRKGRKFWHITQHGWTLRASYWVKQAIRWKTNSVWFCLRDVPRAAQCLEADRKMVAAWGEGGGEFGAERGQSFGFVG